MTEYSIGDESDFVEGRGYQVTIKGINIALFKLNGEFHAISNRCPHKNAPLHIAGTTRYTDEPDEGEDEEEDDGLFAQSKSTRGSAGCDNGNCYVRCPQHNMKFDFDTGETPVADFALPIFDAKVQNGEVLVEI